MAITYSAGAGTAVTTSAKNGTVKSFTGGKVRLNDPITTGNNGNLVASPTYTGRLIYISGGTGVGQTRYISGETLSLGDGDDVDLDVSEPWTTNPDNTSTYEISYILEDAATLAGLSLNTRNGFWEWKRELVIDGSGTFAFMFWAGDKKLVEWYDNGSTSAGSVYIASNGRLDIGYPLVDLPVFGCASVVVNGTDGEWGLQLASGSFTNFYDFQLFGAVANNNINSAGGTHVWHSGKIQSATYVALLGGTFEIDGIIFVGESTTNDTIRIEDTTTFLSGQMVGMYGFESLDDGLTETLEVRNCVFVNTAGRNVRVHDDKTWNFVNPVNLGSDSTLISFEIDDLNQVNRLFSVQVTVTEPDGTAITDADCYIYEGLTNQDLPTANFVDTDSNGYATTDVLVNRYTYPSSVFTTVSYGDFALKVYEWLKLPFVIPIVPDFTITGGVTQGVVLVADPNIVQTTQATAISAGSTITMEQTVNGSSLLSYDTGTIAFNVGDTVVGLTSNANGIVTEITEGTTASGRIHLRNRNAISSFTAGEALQVSGVTRAYVTNPLVQLDFATHIDCQALSLQTVYDYWAARMAEDTLGAVGQTAIEWGAEEWAQIVFADGNSTFRTERNVANTNGVFLSDRGAGGITYMTADDGTQYAPPVGITVSFTNVVGSEIRVYKVSDGSEVAGIETTTASPWDAGLAASVAYNIVALGPLTGTQYKPVRKENVSFSGSQGYDLNQQIDLNFNNP